MRRMIFSAALLLGALTLSISFVGNSHAQGSSSPVVSGGSRLVVSRSSDPAPATTSSMTPSSVPVWRWAEFTFASAREWALSFAPARAASVKRSAAVRRRVTP